MSQSDGTLTTGATAVSHGGLSEDPTGPGSHERAHSLSGFDAGAPLLEVSDLNVRFPSEDGSVHAVRGVDYILRSGEVLGIVGESGSGKWGTSLAGLGPRAHAAQIPRAGR